MATNRQQPARFQFAPEPLYQEPERSEEPPLSPESTRLAPPPTEWATKTFTNGITYASGSVFSWDLTENSNSIGFDTVSGSGALSVHLDSIFRVVQCSVVDLDNLFWSADRSWNIFSGFAGGSFNNSLLQIVHQSGTPVGSSHGHFSVSGSALNRSTNPESSSALAGLLIGAGLLRRKRLLA